MIITEFLCKSYHNTAVVLQGNSSYQTLLKKYPGLVNNLVRSFCHLVQLVASSLVLYTIDTNL